MRNIALAAALASTWLAGALPAATTVSISPTSVELRAAGTVKKFTASVAGTTDKTVTWLVDGIPGGNARVGFIAADGTYTTPTVVPTPNLIEISARNETAGSAPVSATAKVALLNPTPVVTTVEPSTFNVGPFTLKLTGSGFLRTSKVTVGTLAVQATYVSQTELMVTGTASTGGQSLGLKVINPDPGTAASSEKIVKVSALPTVTVSPAAVELRAGTGKKFAASVSVATDKTVTWLVGGIPGGNAILGTIATDGTYTAPPVVPTPNLVEITARNVSAGIVTVSAPAKVTLLNPAPVITTVEPSTINVGPFSLKVTGTGFLPTSKVALGTLAVQVSYVSKTELTVKGTSDAANQSFGLKVSNPDPGAITSNEKTLRVLPPVTVTVSPTSRKMRANETYDFSSSVSNSANRTVIWKVNGIAGGNAQLGTVDADGIYRAPLAMPPGVAGADGVELKLTATSEASADAIGTSAIFVRNAIPQITTLSPVSVTPGAVTLVLNGTGFATGATVRFGGSTLAVSSVTPTQITATGTVTNTPAGIAPVIVGNPNPGAAESNVIAVPVTVAGLVSKATAARFLEQATWGPTPDLLARIQREGGEPYLNEQLAMPPVSIYANPIPDQSSLTPMRRRFFMNALNQPDQLRQRMAFALSQLFVVSAVTVGNDFQMIPYQRMLVDKAFDNYYDVLKAVTLSPTMGRFLDMVNNAKADPRRGTVPNENYPREVLQLFSLGTVKLNLDGSQQRDASGTPIPAYDENVIANLARVFTGWTYPTRPGAARVARNPSYYEGPMEPWEENHDTGQKTLLNGYIIPPGRTAPEELDLALRNIFQHPNVGPFVATRLIRHFVMSNPSPGYISRVASAFNNTNGVRGDLRAVLRAVLTDPEAQVSSATGGHLREPVLYEVSLARALGAVAVEENSLHSYASNMSQNLFQAPSVFNYFSPSFRIQAGTLFAPEFQIHTPSNAVDRANFSYRLMRSAVGGVTVNLDDFYALAADPVTLIAAVDNALYQGRMPDYVKQAISTAMAQTKDMRTRARNALQIASLAGDYLVIH